MIFRMSFFLLIFCFSAITWGDENTATNLDPKDYFFVKFDEKQPFIFLGKVDVNGPGDTEVATLYPGDTAGLFFMSILAHAVITNSISESRITKRQKNANRVLVDYEDFIAKFSNPDEVSISQLNIDIGDAKKTVFFSTEINSTPDAYWSMTVKPIVFMTQSQGSLILFNKIVLQEKNTTGTKPKKSNSTSQQRSRTNPNEKIVVVVSDPIADTNYKNYWSADNGNNFIATIKIMYQQSLALVIGRKLSEAHLQTLEQSTVRYMEDGVKKVERGIVISATCKRTLFESLAGEIKSVPNLDFLNCESAS